MSAITITAVWLAETLKQSNNKMIIGSLEVNSEFFADTYVYFGGGQAQNNIPPYISCLLLDKNSLFT